MVQEKIQKVIITREQIREVYDQGSEAVEALVFSAVNLHQQIPRWGNSSSTIWFKGKALCLIERLNNYKEEILSFS